MQKRTLYFIILILLGCSNKPTHWEQFAGVGLPDQNEHYKDVLFTDDSTGYLAGSRDYTGYGTITQISVLYKTTNGGRDWKQIPTSISGGISNIFAFKDTIILVAQNIVGDTNYILQSVNNGSSWNKLLTYNKANFIRCCYFKNPQTGLIEIENRFNGKQYLLGYYSKKWDTISTIDNNYYNPQVTDHNLFSLIPASSQSADSKGVLITSVNNKKSFKILFDKPYYVGGTAIDNKSYWLACNDSLHNRIFKVNNGKLEIIDLGNFSKYWLSDIFAYKNKIIVFANLKEDESVIGVIHHCLASEDYGKKWQIEDLPSSMTTKPAFMYKDHFLITMCGPPGFLQIRK